MGNVSKRQQPDQRAENSLRPPTGLQHSEKIPHPEAGFSCPLNKMCTNSVKIDVTLNPKTYKLTKIKKTYKTNKGQRLLTWDRRKIAAGLNFFCEISTIPLYL